MGFGMVGVFGVLCILWKANFVLFCVGLLGRLKELGINRTCINCPFFFLSFYLPPESALARLLALELVSEGKSHLVTLLPSTNHHSLISS